MSKADIKMTKATKKLTKRRQKEFTDRYCVYCGCTDSCACADGCSWVVKFPDIMEENPAGICSSVTCLQQFFNDFGRTAKNLAKHAGYL